jgi:UDP-N-acetylmuramate dehydrogenase
MMRALIQDFHDAGIEVRVDVPMAPLTTYGVGGTSSCVVKTTLDGIGQVAEILSSHPDIPVVVLGRGSNVLISDNGFSGVVVLLAGATGGEAIEVQDDRVRVGGGVLMPVLARRSVAAERGGLEWCVGIPGTVGGAVRMNAGGHGADMASSLRDAEIISLKSGRRQIVPADSLGLHFRGSVIAAHHVVTNASLTTTSIDTVAGTNEINAVVSWRREHQPGGRNAGSVFVNPFDGAHSAGALIDELGLRGYSVGSAQVSEKHANFIQASDGATASDILSIMQHVQHEVERVHHIRLRSEVRLIGFSPDIEEQFADPRHNEPDRLESGANLRKVLGEDER